MYIRNVCKSGEEYSAIILDWQMPGMNGLDTAREIRKMIPIDTPVLFLTSYDWTDIETEALSIPIIAMTANAFVKDVQDALDAGMNAHIAKPIQLEYLFSTLEELLAKKMK